MEYPALEDREHSIHRNSSHNNFPNHLCSHGPSEVGSVMLDSEETVALVALVVLEVVDLDLEVVDLEVVALEIMDLDGLDLEDSVTVDGSKTASQKQHFNPVSENIRLIFTTHCAGPLSPNYDVIKTMTSPNYDVIKP